MGTHNICFYGEISKIVPQLSPNTLLICSSGMLQFYRDSKSFSPHNWQIKVFCKIADSKARLNPDC